MDTILKKAALGDPISLSQYNEIIAACKKVTANTHLFDDGTNISQRGVNKSLRVSTYTQLPHSLVNHIFLAKIIDADTPTAQIYWLTSAAPGAINISANYWITPIDEPVELGYMQVGDGTASTKTLIPHIEEEDIVVVFGQYGLTAETIDGGIASQIAVGDGATKRFQGQVGVWIPDGEDKFKLSAAMRPHPFSVEIYTTTQPNKPGSEWRAQYGLSDVNVILNTTGYISTPTSDDDGDNSWLVNIAGNIGQDTGATNKYSVRGDFDFDVEFRVAPSVGDPVYLSFEPESNWRYTLVAHLQTIEGATFIDGNAVEHTSTLGEGWIGIDDEKKLSHGLPRGQAGQIHYAPSLCNGYYAFDATGHCIGWYVFDDEIFDWVWESPWNWPDPGL